MRVVKDSLFSVVSAHLEPQAVDRQGPNHPL